MSIDLTPEELELAKRGVDQAFVAGIQRVVDLLMMGVIDHLREMSKADLPGGSVEASDRLLLVFADEINRAKRGFSAALTGYREAKRWLT